jgi:hypothetical protein
LLETTGMMAEDINQFVPVQDLAGNFVPQEQLQQIKKKRGRPSKKEAENKKEEENIVMDIKEIKKRGRPKKYATAEEARKAKIANTIAGAKRRKEAIMGRGGETKAKKPRKAKRKIPKWVDMNAISVRDLPTEMRGDIPKIIEERPSSPISEITVKGEGVRRKEKGKGLFSAFNKKIEGAVQAVSNTADAVGKKVKDTATAVVYGRNDYPPKVRKLISQYGDKIITGISLHRTPLGKPLMTALQVASGNTFSQKLENTPYDKLFHLFMCIDFAGRAIVMEKNEVINAETSCNLPKETESRVITGSSIPSGLTLNDALEKTREQMGGNFFTYSAKDNNCQDFIVAFLTANNIGDETDKSWVKQDTKVLFEGNDRLRKIANTLTDIGARVDVLRQGAGVIDFEDMKWGSFSKQLQAYNSQHKKELDLHQFAMMILANPDKFQERTKKRARFYINIILKKKGSGTYQSKEGESILEGDPVSVILDSLSDEDLVNLFGGLFSSRVSPNQTYRMPNGMLIRITDEQYARMRDRVDAFRKRIQDAPKQTSRKKFDKGDGGGKGKDLFGAKSGYGIKKSPVNNIGMANSWINYVKAYAKKNNMKYSEALKDPACKAGYKKGGKFDLLQSITDVGTKLGQPYKETVGINPFTVGYDLGHDVIGPALMKGRGMPTSRDAYIAELYDQANLGANGKVSLN